MLISYIVAHIFWSLLSTYSSNCPDFANFIAIPLSMRYMRAISWSQATVSRGISSSTSRLNPGGNSMHRRWNDGKKDRKKEQRRGGGVRAKKGRIVNNSKYSHRVTFALVSQKICCLRRGEVHVHSSLCLDHM